MPRPTAILALLSIGAALLLFLLSAAPLAQGDTLHRILLWHALAPRLAMGLLCGAALGLAGALFQQVLRNPLAEPGTLGIFAGERLALAAVTLWAPGWLALGQPLVATAGAVLAMLLVLLLSRQQGFAPLAVILAGLVVSLALDAGNRALVLLNFEALSDLWITLAGGLGQGSWSMPLALLPWLGGAAVLAALLRRPLALLELGEAGARGLGLPLPLIRALGLGVAVLLGAAVAGTAGGIGFVGLAGPALARGTGARPPGQRMLGGSLMAAGLLAMTDQALRLLAEPDIPAGGVTALLGAPPLLWLMRRMPRGMAGPVADVPLAKVARPAGPLLLLGVALLLAVGVALCLGRLPDGTWHWAGGAALEPLLTWRAPRLVAALAAGAMLGAAGVLIQRLTGNPMASPELLGVSAGAGLAMMLGVLLLGSTDRLLLTGLAAMGAGSVLAVLLLLGRRSGFSPDHMLLAGVALTMLAGAVTVLLLAGGDPRMALLLGWLAGSTYTVTVKDAWLAVAVAVPLLLATPLAARWLTLLPLGPAVGRGLGLALGRARLALLLLTAGLTAAATLLVGPLSFTGLMAPHLARMLGLRRPLPHLAGAALAGALVIALADWLGRTAAFPWQLPAGLVATLMGSAYVIWLLARR